MINHKRKKIGTTIKISDKNLYSVQAKKNRTLRFIINDLAKLLNFVVCLKFFINNLRKLEAI